MDIRRSFAKLLGAVLVVGTAVVAGAPGSATGATCQSWGAQPPNRTQEINRLSGVVVLSPCRAWAVGSYNVPPVSQTLIEEWNGTAWHVQQSPNANTSTPNDLEGVTATSTKDAWAVGLFFTSGSVARTLTEHWNGTAWSLVPSPSPGTGDDLSGVDAVSSTDVWAVGS
ncbi:MAG TPA: hypothetical protein VNN79_19795, partial [Actinomycetota bacterium]|nr:hypothetical protein [Actinomycetota bacterium]